MNDTELAVLIGSFYALALGSQAGAWEPAKKMCRIVMFISLDLRPGFLRKKFGG